MAKSKPPLTPKPSGTAYYVRMYWENSGAAYAFDVTAGEIVYGELETVAGMEEFLAKNAGKKNFQVIAPLIKLS